MAGNSTLDPENMPVLPGQSQGHGHDVGTLGPSDTSDSGSDMQGTQDRKKAQRNRPGGAAGIEALRGEEGANTDSQGTGDRASVEPGYEDLDGSDIDVDHIETITPAD